MEKRKYTKIQILEVEMESMHKAGKTHREIAEHFGLERNQVKRCLERLRRRQRKQAAGIIAKAQGPSPQGWAAAAAKHSLRASAAADGKPTAAGFSGVYRKGVWTRVKYHVIYLHRNDYPITAMCQFFGVSRSGYYDFVHRLGRPEPDAELGRLLQEQQTRVRQTYGYRRMWLWLEGQGIHRNPRLCCG